jgi:zinc finger protein
MKLLRMLIFIRYLYLFFIADPIESLCMECGAMGETKYMFTTIPFFREVIISAFSCEECGNKNSEIQFAGKIEDYGVKYEVKVINPVAFNRKVVKSDNCTIRVPEAGLEIPPDT